MPTYNISGHVHDRDTAQPIANLKIELWDEDLVFDDLVAETTTDRNGYFSFAFSETGFITYFGDNNPDLTFKVFRDETQLTLINDGILRNVQAGTHTVNLIVDLTYSVEGHVLEPDGSPVGNRQVKAYDKALSGNVLLGEFTTDTDGHYVVNYDKNDLSDPAKMFADLFVEVYNPGTGKLLMQSPLILKAFKHETVNLVLAEADYAGPAEYSRHSSSLAGSLDGLNLSDIDAACVLMLANATGIAQEEITFYVRAQVDGIRCGLAAELLYGLFRQGQNEELKTLLAQDMSALQTGLVAAARSNQISPALLTDWATVEDDLQTARATIALEVTPGTSNPLVSYFSVAGMPAASHSQLLNVWVRNTGPVEDFWAQMKTTHGAANIDRFQLALQLSAVTHNHAPMVASLVLEAGVSDLRDLAAYDTGMLLGVINDFETGVPDDIEGESQAEKAENYATKMLQIVEDIFPTAVAAHRMNGLGKADLSRIGNYALAHPDLDLASSNIAQFLVDHPPAANDLAALEQDLPAMQRLFRISPRHGKMDAIQRLWEEDVKSAHAILRMGEPAFLRKFGPDFGDTIAKKMYKEASGSAAYSLAALSKYHERFQAAETEVTPGQELPENAPVEIPNLHTLFGGVDFCNCKACRSVLSPAAYLVDLLVFLENAEGIPPKTGLDALLERRPDIAHLELSCANTNTLLPYIDLVNEILEQAVAGVPAPTMAEETPQTTESAAFLQAHPANLVPAAYDILANANYPWALPFNLWREEVTVFLKHLGLQRATLMRTLPNAMNPVGDFEIACETLDILPAEASDIITKLEQSGDLAAVYGISGGNPLTDLQPVTAFLEQTDLSFPELQALLAVPSINPGKQVMLDFTGQACDLENAQLMNLNLQFLDQLRRFVRLRARTGWTILELDQTMRALGRTEIDAGFVVTVADIQQLQARFGLPLESMLAWWSEIDRGIDGIEGSLYQRLFLNGFIDNYPMDAEVIFGLDGTWNEVANTGNVLTDPSYLAPVLSGVNLEAGELEAILQAELPDALLSLGNLSRLYRVSTFCKSLEISVADYLSLQALTGKVVLGQQPSDTLEFIALLDRISATGFSIAELNYLLRHEFEATSTLAADDTEIAVMLEEMRTELRTTATENAPNTTSQAEQLEQQLALLIDAEKVQTTMEMAAPLLTAEVATWTDLISNELAFFLDPADAIAQLVNPATLTSGEDRVHYLLAHLQAFLLENIVVSKIAAMYALEASTVEQLLKVWLPNPGNQSFRAMTLFTDSAFVNSDPEVGIDRAGFPSHFSLCELLDKIGLVLGKLSPNRAAVEFLFEQGGMAGFFDLRDLPLARQAIFPASEFANWLALTEAFVLEKAHINSPYSVSSLLKFAQENIQASDRTLLLEELSAATGWESNDLDYLTGPDALGLMYPADFQVFRWLEQVARVMPQIKRLALPAQQVASLTQPDVTRENAARVINAVKAKYDNDRWLQLAPDLRNPLRERQRSALQSYLIANDPAFRDTNDLYAHYLIDTEMSSCAMTSRIVQANAAIQLLVQRIGMNLEAQISLSKGDMEEWKWRKNYRVWEANRKVFLYPENWIEPDLRDDKSPLFKELEAALHADAVSEETVAVAYQTYLRGLDELANLEVAGFFRDKEQQVLHVFARTKGTPAEHYYRRWVDNSYWTAWEKVDLQIMGNHLIPFMYNRRLYLFWPEIKEKPKSTEVKNPDTYFEIKMAWSEYQQGRWARKRVSEPYLREKVEDSTLFFLVNRYARMYIGTLSEGTMTSRIAYQFNGASGNLNRLNEGKIEAGLGNFQAKSSIPGMPLNLNQKMIVEDDADLVLPGIKGKGAPLATVLKNVPITGEVVWSHLDWKKFADNPFFYTDENRSFFVLPQISETGNYTQPNSRYPVEKDKVSMNSLDQFDTQYWPAVEVEETLGSQDQGIVNRGDGNFFYSQYDSPRVINRSSNEASVEAASADSAAGDVVAKGDLGQLSKALSPEKNPVHFGKYGVGKRYQFFTFYHPYTYLFLKQLNRHGVDGLLDPNPNHGADAYELSRQLTPGSAAKFNFLNTYSPSLVHVKQPFPQEQIDFTAGGAYSQYNWELFFHCPFQIATKLSTDQKFAEAQRWFHYIFNPTEMEGQAPARYWKVKPFFEFDAASTIQEIMDLINGGDAEMEALVARWEKDPFKPHLIARFRLVAYMRAVVMKYLDNLIAWGDQLFRQDSRESLNQATQLYILAAQILGRRPEQLQGETATVQTFAQMQPNLDAFSNALVELENTLQAPAAGDSSTSSNAVAMLNSILYFCIPENTKLLGYWETVADRLFKLRNCLNFAGSFRQLALFQPPIDPALLVKAVANGVDLGTALNDLNAPLPHYRFSYLLPKALEFANEVKSLGANLLSALEKRDAEELAVLRTRHEIAIQNALKDINSLQVDEAKASLEGLRYAKVGVLMRQQYYKNILHTSPGERVAMSQRESANYYAMLAQGYDLAASVVRLIGNFSVGVTTGKIDGGQFFGDSLTAFGNVARMFGTSESHKADRSSVTASYDRRWNEWKHQEQLAGNELTQMDKQLIAAEIRLNIAERNLEIQETRIENANEVADYLKYKYTNTQLYNWMVSQISTLYFQAYQMAYDLAKRVEQCYRHELGIDNSNFIQFGYWDSLKKGLLAGERISNDLRRMEAAYLANNAREYEVTKHFSVAQIDPEALLALRETGTATVHLPEVLYDLDFPGQYMRRIKNVRLTMPCITGPYTSVSCKLTLKENRIRKHTSVIGGYGYQGISDTRFVQNTGGFEAIATSTAQGDSGLFELNFRDERYLPFEGAGAISTWEITLAKDYRQFDYDSITDVVLHLSYTAREGGQDFGSDVSQHLKTGFNRMLDELEAAENGLYRLISLRESFPNALHQFLHPVAGSSGQETEIEITDRHLPFFLNPAQLGPSQSLTLRGASIYWKLKDSYRVQVGSNVSNMILQLAKDNAGLPAAQALAFEANELGGLPAMDYTITSGHPTGAWKLSVDSTAVEAFPAVLRAQDAEQVFRLIPEAIEDIYFLINYKL